MRPSRLFSCALYVAVSVRAEGQERTQTADPQEVVDFYGKVQPLLAIHCAKCHGPEKPKAGLRLDVRESVLGKREGGDPVVLPGKSDRSELIKRVTSKDKEERMPPKGEALTAAEVRLLRKWIDQGATWPEKDDYWAFKPPAPVATPRVKDPRPVPNAIDSFILHKLESKGLGFSSPADKIALLRRAFADLVGMPPSPEEARAFLEDGAPDAYERLVDRLLADLRYGERWARHWLDLVRYAESDGFEYDRIRPHAWRYRDYVIRSFNEDKPYDRFVLEQIAGDELFPDDPDAWVATGFARLGPWDAVCKNEKHRWQEFLNDATDTTGAVFLGLTVGCARCHDHKYDRITQTDYFSLQAFFAGVRRDRKDLPAGGNDPVAFRRRFEEGQSGLKALHLEKKLLREKHALLVVMEKAAQGEPDEKLAATDDDVKKSIDKLDKKKAEEIDRQIKKLEADAEFYRPSAEATFDAGRDAPKTRLLWRGNLQSPGPEVAPAFIAALRGDRPPVDGKSRSALARWLASPENPMTARVMVNRLWRHHFGRGLVPTPSDFGRNGQAPTHPELLDWLAVEFMRSGWRLKAMHRLMMTSATFVQTSKGQAGAVADPENRLLWRANRRRLEAEAIRDGILAVSGRLNLKRGGPGVYPKISKEAMDVDKMPDLPKWGASPEEDGFRRTVYVFQRRSLMLPIVQAFDGADMSHTCAARDVTTVAPQALSLFNSEFTRGEALAFAERVARDVGEGRDRQVERAYRLALVRGPTTAEKERAWRFLDEHVGRRLKAAGSQAGAPPDVPAERAALANFCHVLLNTNEFIYID